MDELARLVEKIECGACNYYDASDKFRDATPEELREFGSIYAGTVCPICNNLSDFDFDPDGTITDCAENYIS